MKSLLIYDIKRTARTHQDYLMPFDRLVQNFSALSYYDQVKHFFLGIEISKWKSDANVAQQILNHFNLSGQGLIVSQGHFSSLQAMSVAGLFQNQPVVVGGLSMLTAPSSFQEPSEQDQKQTALFLRRSQTLISLRQKQIFYNYKMLQSEFSEEIIERDELNGQEVWSPRSVSVLILIGSEKLGESLGIIPLAKWYYDDGHTQSVDDFLKQLQWLDKDIDCYSVKSWQSNPENYEQRYGEKYNPTGHQIYGECLGVEGILAIEKTYEYLKQKNCDRGVVLLVDDEHQYVSGLEIIKPGK